MGEYETGWLGGSDLCSDKKCMVVGTVTIASVASVELEGSSGGVRLAVRRVVY